MGCRSCGAQGFRSLGYGGPLNFHPLNANLRTLGALPAPSPTSWPLIPLYQAGFVPPWSPYNPLGPRRNR